MRKIKEMLVVIGVIVCVGLVGCVTDTPNKYDDPTAVTKEDIKKVQEETNSPSEDKIEKKDHIPVEVFTEQLSINGYLAPPNSIGNVYYHGQVTNNSEYTFTGVMYKYNVDGERAYLSWYETLLPGDTSTESFCVGAENMTPLSIQVTLLDENGDEHSYEYDFKLNSVRKYF